MITWLWRTANDAQRSLHDIAIRLVWLDIASIVTTSTVSRRVKCSWLRLDLLSKVLTHILYDLATYTSYIEPLREEISMIVEAGGWTKISMEKMRKLDSFMKESHRLNGSGFGKKNCNNLGDDPDYSNLLFLLSHDSTIGDEWLFFLWWPFHSERDEFCCRWSWNQSRWGKFLIQNLQNFGRYSRNFQRYYDNPQEFQGFRFADKDPLKWQMTSINPEFMLFGLGRSAW